MSGIDLNGSVALVTGASRGIGAVIACRLAEAGAKVGVHYLSSKELAEAVVAKITNYGALLTSLHLPDLDGKPSDVVLGFDN